MRNTLEDNPMRMLNDLGAGTRMHIHRHLSSSEIVTLHRGKIFWHFYDDARNEMESVVLDARGEPKGLNVEKGLWRLLECLESGLVLLENKDGRYESLGENELLKV